LAKGDAERRTEEDMIANASRAAAFGLAAVLSLSAAHAADDKAEREARWTELRQTVFGDRKVEDGDLLSLDTPVRAEDASMVPIALKSSRPGEVKAATLFIDDNPAPVAGKITFGPAGDASLTKLRVRVNTYSNVRAVAETSDGRLVETANFVKASGGCSAPVGASDEEAMQGMGDMRLRVRDEVVPGKSALATLMIRHPNFSGMQMDQVKRTYTPARYIKTIKVTYNDKDVFTLDGDISISSNPVIEFGFKPEAKGKITVAATDTENAHWEKSFDVPSQGN
jgi:sulfur-oxidizing protein SoxY